VAISRGVALPFLAARAANIIQRAETEVANPSAIPSSKGEVRYEKAITEGDLNLSDACRVDEADGGRSPAQGQPTHQEGPGDHRHPA
jgi:hypothetical protein